MNKDKPSWIYWLISFDLNISIDLKKMSHCVKEQENKSKMALQTFSLANYVFFMQVPILSTNKASFAH